MPLQRGKQKARKPCLRDRGSLPRATTHSNHLAFVFQEPPPPAEKMKQHNSNCHCPLVSHVSPTGPKKAKDSRMASLRDAGLRFHDLPMVRRDPSAQEYFGLPGRGVLQRLRDLKLPQPNSARSCLLCETMQRILGPATTFAGQLALEAIALLPRGRMGCVQPLVFDLGDTTFHPHGQESGACFWGPGKG